jgi:hypothetical protein
MPVGLVRKAVAAGAIAIVAATTLVACSAEVTSREASAYRASRLCVLNDTDKTIMSVGEYEMTRTGESHPDPTGPLKPDATWCTNGYNSFEDSNGDTQDASVEIKFSEAGGDFTRFAVNNPGSGYPTMVYGQRTFDQGYFQPGFMNLPWEVDDTVPDSNTSNPRTGPSHDYHMRRLDDTPDFKEWLITVRR